MRNHPAGDGDFGTNTSCPSIRPREKRGRSRVRCRIPNVRKSFSRDPDVPEDEVAPVDSNCRLKLLRSKEIPSESRCPKAKDDIMEDSWTPIQEAVSEDLLVMQARTASTAKLKIPDTSLEKMVENVSVLVTRNPLAWESVGGGQPLGAVPNLEYPLSFVQIRVRDALEMPSSQSGLCKACLVDQT